MRKWLVVGAVAIGAGALPRTGAAQVTPPSTGGVATTSQAARMLGHTKRVLMVAAHPDDEDTELLTYLVRKEGAVAAYLSLTRGEGGQNLIGRELGAALGLIRTEELLAARGLDGARQYFTRAFDFGFSKTQAEAFRFWPQDSVLKDVVRIVRRFRPQIMVSIFSGTPRDGHGQHQVAGWVAQEAFRVAGDSTRFPELTLEEGLAPWQPLKLFRSARFDTTGGSLILEGGLLDPEVGQSFRQIAMRGRSLHRSQDMGMLQEIGPSPIRLALLADRTGGGPNLFAGVDTAARSTGVEATDLARYRAIVEAASSGIIIDATANTSRVVPGDPVAVRLSVWNSGGGEITATPHLTMPAGWRSSSNCLGRPVSVRPQTVHACEVLAGSDPATPLTVPYFLEQPRSGALYHWSGEAATWGEPFEPAPLIASFDIAVSGRSDIRLDREVSFRYRDQALGELRRPVAIVPRVSVRVEPAVAVWSTLEARAEPITVVLQHAGTDTTRGTVALRLPQGWPAVEPQPFRLTRPDERRTITFLVRRPSGLRSGSVDLAVQVSDDRGRVYTTGVVTVNYPHIRERVYPIPATVAVHAAAIALPSKRRIGYVRGAADLVPEALQGLGIDVEILDPTAIERGDLAGFDAIVIGARAYETDLALVENNDRLLDYARRGGHLVVQYQQHAFFTGNYAPYPLAVAPQHDRVTDETAPVRILDAADPVFRVPNRITDIDWLGWIQERGLYFARSWDARYRPLLSMNDVGEAPREGGLLTAVVGKGTYTYTGLAFFRQLVAGVPGAFRLFVNLVSPPPRRASCDLRPAGCS